MLRCTSMLVVLLLKAILRTDISFGGSDSRYLEMVTVFAVPDSPTKRIGLRSRTNASSRKVVRTVSTVGTSMLAKRLSCGGSNSGTIDLHVFQ